MSNYLIQKIEEVKPTLKSKQKEALISMIKGENIFLTGPGGVGKTSIIKIFRKLASPHKKISVTSTTGTSAILLEGSTLHSYLGIGYGTDHIDKLVKKICTWTWLRKRWQELESLVIDEISMLSPDLFDKLNEIAKRVRKSSKPFGGIQLILSGDFLQLPCVGTNDFCFHAESWKECIDKTIYLDEIIRQGDVTYQNCLNNIRLGIITKKDRNLLDRQIGKNLENSLGIKPTKLFAINYDVDMINNMELDNLAEDGRQFYEYEMKTILYSKNKSIISKFKKNCSAPELLQLCKGAQVMLLINLSVQDGLANGSRGVITGFTSEDLPIVRFLNGKEQIIENYTWEVKENGKKILTAEQIPLKVAYAISIHKSQGSSLDYAEIDLSNIFECGQAYVALSRVKSLEGLSIKSINYDQIRAHPEAVNFYENLE